ncbi:MAG: hypothetical protein ABL866_04245 [Devosia sp.]
MPNALVKAETSRSVAAICLVIGIALIAACLINPRGVYNPWELTFGICVVFVIGSAGALAYFHSRVIASRSGG